MTPSPFPFTPAGLAISKIVAGIKPPPRFPETFCSHCGGAFGPGNSGFSHCEDHAGLRDLDADDDEPRVPHTPREEEEFA